MLSEHVSKQYYQQNNESMHDFGVNSEFSQMKIVKKNILFTSLMIFSHRLDHHYITDSSSTAVKIMHSLA